MNAPTLLDLYHVASKHNHYQVLPTALEPLLKQDQITVKSRHEIARLNYIAQKLDVTGLHVADVGGNTGFFSFELLDRGARLVDYYEGNQAHHDFVRASAQQLGLNDRLRTFNRYVTFAPNELDGIECTLLLNVLHHLGDDFGDAKLNKEAAKENILSCLASLSHQTRSLVFQLGFNWKGDRNQPLFTGGTKTELIQFIRDGTASDWVIEAIGVAEKSKDAIAFHDLTPSNIERNNALGEFLNRPIFIMRSKHFTGASKVSATAKFDPEKEKTFLNGLVSDYKDVSPYSQVKKDVITRLLDSYITNGAQKSGLQYGCANGYETQQLASRLHDLTVVDGSTVFVDRLLAANTLSHTSFTCSLFEDFDFARNGRKYDYIFCSYIFEHVFDPQIVLANIRTLLKPSGLLFIVVPNYLALSRQIALKMGLLQRLEDLTENDHRHGHRRVYDRDSLSQEVTSAGLVVRDVKGVVLKILADFQLNKLLSDGFLKPEHIYALQQLAQEPEHVNLSDSLFLVATL
jgi:2-polyprenyl-3-methyl-5-hydroxy-6-metoxy-1,4-benzoquinol methylase